MRPYNRIVVDITDLQTMLIAVMILTAVAAVIFFGYFRKQRQTQHIQTFKTAPAQYAKLKARKLAAEWPPQTLNAVPIDSRPAMQPSMKREFVVEMAPSSPAAPLAQAVTSSHAELQPAAIAAALSHPSFTPPLEITSPVNPTPLAALPATLPPVTATPVDAPQATLPPVTIDSALWERLTSSHQPNQTSPAASARSNAVAILQPTLEMIRDHAPAKNSAETIQQPELEHLMEANQMFTGLVVSIGINETSSGVDHPQDFLQSVKSCLGTLLRECDLCWRTAAEEFVIVCPEEACPDEPGASSQRRLNQITERLWDYQLRDISAPSILFHWDGVQVQDRPLAEAIASATERMRETKRTGHSAKLALAYREVV